MRRGVLVEVNGATIYLTDNAFMYAAGENDARQHLSSDAKFIDQLLGEMACGGLEADTSPGHTHRLTISDKLLTKDQSAILFADREIAGEVPNKEWQGSLAPFRSHPQSFKVPLVWLETHIALLVKAFSAVGCSGWSSCQGHLKPFEHIDKLIFSNLHLALKGPIHARWAEYILADAMAAGVSCEDLGVEHTTHVLKAKDEDSDHARNLTGSGRERWLVHIQKQAIDVGLHTYRNRKRLGDERLDWINRYALGSVTV